MSENINDAELKRDLMNLNIPEEKRHIPIVEWEELEISYGKENIEKHKKHVEEKRKDRSAL